MATLWLASVGLAWHSIRHEQASLEVEIDRRGKVLATTLAEAASAPLRAGDESALNALTHTSGESAGVTGVWIMKQDGVVAAALDAAARGTTRASALTRDGAERAASREVQTLRDQHASVYVMPIFAAADLRDTNPNSHIAAGAHSAPPREALLGEVQVEIDLQRLVSPVLRERAQQFTVGALFLAALGVLAALAFVQHLVGPLRRLRAGVEKLSHGNFNVRVPPTSSDEIGELTRAFNAMGEALEQKERLQTAFGRYVNEHVLTHLLESPSGVELLGVEREITVVFVDIRRFTRLSEGMNARDVVTLLNEVFQLISDEILGQGGTIDKFIGDSVMAYFGAPAPQRDHALRAVRAAIAIQATIEKRSSTLKSVERAVQPSAPTEARAAASTATLATPAPTRAHAPPATAPTVAARPRAQAVQLGIGVHTGKVVVGNIGSNRRTDFTVVGDTVNVASRLEKLALPGQILVSEAVQREVRSMISLKFEGERQLVGREEAVHVYSVPLGASAEGRATPDAAEDHSERP